MIKKSLYCQVEIGEKELIKRCKQGDREALAWLYTTYSARLLTLCRRIVSDDAAAEDLLHDSFIIIFSSINTLRNDSVLEAWMSRIVVNMALRYIRQRHTAADIDGVEIAADDAESADMSERLSFDEIMRLVDSLPDGYRNVFRLSVLDGLSHAEIAGILGIEPRSSSSQLARAKQSLRRKIYEYLRLMAVVALLVAVGVTLVVMRDDGEKPLTAVRRPAAEVRKGEAVSGNTSAAATETPVTAVTGSGGYARQTSPAGDITDVLSLLADSLPSVDMSLPLATVTAFNDSSALASVPQQRLSAVPDIYVWHGEKREGGGSRLMFGLTSVAGQNSGSMAARLLSLISHSVETATRVDVETWEELAHYLAYDVGGDISPDERYALLEVASENSGRIVTRKRFDKPLQVGFNFGKRLTDRLSLDFGLRFTRHTTHLTTGNTDTTSIMERQRTYFVGLPFGITYNMFRRGRWALYGTSGMAVDIPVYGSSVMNINLDNAVIYRRKNRMEMPRWQLSVNVGGGISYDLSPHLQLFFSPRVTWYVPNGSLTETQWTDKPLQVTLPFGLRFVLE